MDAGTIEAARRGDRRSQATLLGALQDVWYRFALSMLHDTDRAADATQETALRFLKQLSSFRGDSQLQTWSLGIALNVVREMRRKSRTTETLETEELAAERRVPASREVLAGSGIEQREEQDQMRSMLHQLPDRQREAITLRFFEELSVEETASLMGCATGTVKATVHQALRALRQKMSPST